VKRSLSLCRRLAPVLLLGALLPVGPAAAQYRMSAPRATSADLDSLRVAYQARPKDEQTALYYARALAARNSIRERSIAVRVLKQAVDDHPESGELRLALADLYYRQGYLTLSRQELRRALSSPSEAAPAYVRLGRIALRDWLKFQRPEALNVAEDYWRESARRAPQDPEPWLGLGILALLAGDGAGAERYGRNCLAAAAKRRLPAAPVGLYPEGARGATPERAQATPDPLGEGLLLVGAGAFLQGKLELSDSAFAQALPRLRSAARERLSDITAAASDEDTVAWRALAGDPRGQAEFLRRFWRSRDPDLTTAVNEVRLELLTRGTLAYLLFFDQRLQTWDERAALLVRYGVPAEVQYNPPGLEWGPITTNRLVWFYPSLGMAILLEDRYLNEAYDLPVSLFESVDPLPDPAAVAVGVGSGELAVAGRGVFRATKRGTVPLAGRAEVALFRRVRGFDPRSAAPPGGDVARAEIYLATAAGAAGGEVEAEAVVLDSVWREVARQKIGGAVVCHADSFRVAQVNFDLPPGEYTVGVSARDRSRSAAATWRLPLRVQWALPGKLEVSDLELACAYRSEPDGSGFDKMTFGVVPDPRREVPAGRPLGVYFEIYGLVPDDAGRGQLALEYTVRSLRPDKRPFFAKWVNPRREEPRVQTVREDEVPGRVRYQYVSVDLEDPAPGPYRLEVRVTDRVSGQVAAKSLDFTVGGGAGGS